MSKTAYSKLLGALEEQYWISSTQELLSWDEQVNLPPGSAENRMRQNAFLAELHHREATRPEIGEWLSELEAGESGLSGDERTVIRWVRRDYDRLRKLPASFIVRKTEAQSRSFHAWAEAKEKGEFAGFAPFLEEVVSLAREEAEILGWNEKPYDYHIDQHDPGMSGGRIEDLFGRLRGPLVELFRGILESPVKAETVFLQDFPEDRQEVFVRGVVEKLGFDFERGQLDRSLHPFCGGDGADTRMTTRYDAGNPLDSLFSSIHETGHALYEQGLPVSDRSNPLGRAIGMAVHESQSRLWENQVGRSRAFWSYFEPLLHQAFRSELAGISSDDLYLAINSVRLTPVRLDADEIGYNLHIMLRFELEKALFGGELEVRDLPAEWNRLSAEIVGCEPANDVEGILQDVHWAVGGFGYFPSYCLGNMMAAQLWYAAKREHPELEAEFAKGEFGTLLGWLRERIHKLGRRLDTDGIVRYATGEPLAPDALLRFLKERYLPLYAVS